MVTVAWQAYAEEFAWTSQAFYGVHRLSDSLWLDVAFRLARLLLSILYS